MSFRIAVIASGEGSNLQALIDRVHGRDGIEIVAVASNRPHARALTRAADAGIPARVFAAPDRAARPARDAALAAWLDERGVQLVVLAGFMEVLSREFVRRFAGRLINVHPSLLPAFPGVRAIEQALAYGVRVSGVTVHFVDEGVDTGPIILQEAFRLFPYARDITDASDTAEVERQVHEIEHRLLPEAVRLIARGAVRVDPDDPRRVRIEGDGGD